MAPRSGRRVGQFIKAVCGSCLYAGKEERSFTADGRSGQTPFVGCLVNHNAPPTPPFFVSVASKGVRCRASPLFATHTKGPISVASKGLILHQNCAHFANLAR